MIPSAPPAGSMQSDERPPPLNPELLSQAVKNFFAGDAGKILLEDTARQLLRRAAVAAEVRSGQLQLQQARSKEEAALKSYAQRSAKEAAQDAARAEASQLHALIADAVAGAVRRAVEREVPVAVRDDPLMKRLLAENLNTVRGEVHRAAEKELAEICDEEKYQRVNQAFLAALESRAETSVRSATEKVESSLQGTHQAIRNSKILGIVAVMISCISLFQNRSRL
eukprot:TRINITY_DN61400_c0_g1_i1.p1 TRINITY_DN61400_c0_g1~~TRINITY_DN61400_c0_g1_i1.p1  ORF type:complete len:249 (-),score=44.04 TRINITY_DN61400_c0_g1_i1:10-684(-)